MSGKPASGGTPRRSAGAKRSQAGKRGGKPAKKATAKKKPPARTRTGRASTTHGGPSRTDHTKLGRPTKRTSETDAVVIDALTTGLDYRGAAMLIKVSESTLRKWRTEDQDFSADCEKAIAEGQLRYARKLWDIASGETTAKGMVAAIFWLKTRTQEFREKADLTAESADAVAERVRQALAKGIPASDFEGDGAETT